MHQISGGKSLTADHSSFLLFFHAGKHQRSPPTSIMSTDVTATETTAPGTETPAADPVVDTTPETPAGDTKPAKETKAAKAKKPARPRKPRATPYTPPMPRWFLRRSLTHNYLILHKADPRRQGCIVHVNDVRGLSSKSRWKGTAVR